LFIRSLGSGDELRSVEELLTDYAVICLGGYQGWTLRVNHNFGTLVFSSHAVLRRFVRYTSRSRSHILTSPPDTIDTTATFTFRPHNTTLNSSLTVCNTTITITIYNLCHTFSTQSQTPSSKIAHSSQNGFLLLNLKGQSQS
jgi:hypothetical protein